MSYLHRVSPNKTTSSHIKATYVNGKMVDANTKEPLVAGKIDKGHKAGYEERVMRKCAEKLHMSQKDYNKMMQDPRLYQFETSKNNRSHKFESKDYSLQLHNCFEVIRNYQGKNRTRAVKGFETTEFTHSSKQNGLNEHTNSGGRNFLGKQSVSSGHTSSNGHNFLGNHISSNGHGSLGSHNGSASHGGIGNQGNSSGHGGIDGHGSSSSHGGSRGGH